MIETLADIARHLDVLDLVAPDRHAMRVEDQDVRGHQDRVHEQAGRDAGIAVLAVGQVAIDRGLVGMRAIEQSLRRHAGKHPGQLGDLGDIRLPIEEGAIRIEAKGQPGRRDLETRLRDPRRILALDQGVIVGEKVERLDIVATTGLDRGTDRADVVAEMGRAGRGDAGQRADLRNHGQTIVSERPV